MKWKKGTKSTGERGRVRTDLTIQIGRAAREARQRLGLTQEDVAERVRITAEVYGRIERGDMLPATPTLKRICGVLGISADSLIGLTGPEAPQTRPSPEEALTPDVRRLLRVVRTLDPGQLAVFRGTAAGFLRLKKRRQRQQHKHDKSQGAIT
ncbi:helix-turn-helix domain-containing protein [Vitiosangium sp. GDMCC 1.1324]|uniref:helix-turn-helix domain-containing protein n=1 Tax=Vitiosangium sp. (strain GDMCC 1.1324) TaxID=2138576 RepID=UPI000D331B9F|nr:helix-turn-helix domain-containing protein [Vitiosangium sp. GDMCC 1.1324]PTL75184.1 transcriptional regulator [Vitiosangium sp. GDMCC 1.1324]